jgi:hypothetical protein
MTMPHFPDHPTLEVVLYSTAASSSSSSATASAAPLATTPPVSSSIKEQELFTTQKGFKTLYEQEIGKLKEENAAHVQKTQALEARVEDYRKKAAGLGGLFHSGGKKPTRCTPPPRKRSPRRSPE